MINLFGRNNKTFKPKKDIPPGSRHHDLMNYRAETLGTGNLRNAVSLPNGEILEEWVALNILDFYNQISMLYGTIMDYCTEQTCPKMTAGPKYEYKWPINPHKSVNMPAKLYIDNLMSWVSQQLDNSQLFPSTIGVPFPSCFMSEAKQILRRLFRVYAHIYYLHFDRVQSLKEEPHLNTSFKHFIFFVLEFKLIDKKELAPLDELIQRLVNNNS